MSMDAHPPDPSADGSLRVVIADDHPFIV